MIYFPLNIETFFHPRGFVEPTFLKCAEAVLLADLCDGPVGQSQMAVGRGLSNELWVGGILSAHVRLRWAGSRVRCGAWLTCTLKKKKKVALCLYVGCSCNKEALHFVNTLRCNIAGRFSWRVTSNVVDYAFGMRVHTFPLQTITLVWILHFMDSCYLKRFY